MKPAKPKKGPPFRLEGGKRVNVYLDAPTLAKAEIIGGGKVSIGLRVAVAKYRLRPLPPKVPSDR